MTGKVRPGYALVISVSGPKRTGGNQREHQSGRTGPDNEYIGGCGGEVGGSDIRHRGFCWHSFSVKL